MSPIYNTNQEKIGYYSPDTNTVTLQSGVTNLYNPYLSMEPGTYTVGGKTIYLTDTTIPLGYLGRGNVLFPWH